MTCGQNFEHALSFEMSLEKVLSNFCHAKIRKGLRMASTVSD